MSRGRNWNTRRDEDAGDIQVLIQGCAVMIVLASGAAVAGGMQGGLGVDIRASGFDI